MTRREYNPTANVRRIWVNMGARAAMEGFALDRVLTKNEKINEYIREGYGPVPVSQREKEVN